MIALKHFNTIMTHKKWVFYFARKLGIGWQGFWHDMSKFSPTEFCESIRYYTGTSSPIDECKKANGYSMAWLHHKGRNAHHYEHWQDNFDRGGEPLRMPDKYVREMICDYLAAGRAYKGKEFHFASEWQWWLNKNKNNIAMHPENWKVVNQVLSDLNDSFGTKRIEDMSAHNWMHFKHIVDRALSK